MDCDASLLLILCNVQFHLHVFSVVVQEHCQTWEDELMEVIDTEKKDSEHTFPKKSQQFSCQLEPLISYHNSTKAEWQFFNLSGNVLALYDGGPLSRVAKLKVCLFSSIC